ncbi:MAG: hypothetical protein H6Q01_609, partial [Acidobacteria bacterium]|nr:hypothetical protein [Acidobacteriota bacterium]
MSARGVLAARTRAVLVSLAAVAAVLCLGPAAAAEWEEVGLEVSLPPRVQTAPGETVLVAMFRANDHERIDIGLEMARWARREIARST